MTDTLFYSREDEYGFLSNFWQASEVIDRLIYPTNEHFYQSQRAKDPRLREWIRLSPHAYAAMQAGRSLRPKETIANWDTVKFDVMLKGLKAKFRQNEDLGAMLLATGSATLHENSPTDMVWGIKGKDMLGKLLMQVRSELR